MGTRQVPVGWAFAARVFTSEPFAKLPRGFHLVSPNSTGSLLQIASEQKSEPCLARSEPPKFCLEEARGRDIATP